MSHQILFTPPTSAFEPTFWEVLYHKKLNVYRLDTSPVDITANFIPAGNREKGSIKFTGASFDGNATDHIVKVQGKLINVNKIEEFSALDKKKLIVEEAETILSAIVNGQAIENPRLLNQFTLITFADLKTYKFVFWFAQPTLTLAQGLHTRSPFSPFIMADDFAFVDNSSIPVDRRRSLLTEVYTHLITLIENGGDIPPVFAVRASTRLETQTSQSLDSSVVEDVEGSTIVLGDTTTDSRLSWEVLSLHEAWHLRHDTEHIHFVVLDQSHQDQALGWTTRNFFTLLALYAGQASDAFKLSPHASTEEGITSRTFNILALRNPLLQKATVATVSAPGACEQFVNQDVSVSGVVSVPVLTVPPIAFHSEEGITVDVTALATALFPNDTSGMHIVGWEPNERGKAGPRVADLRASLDTRLLMSQAVDLNLRLMKWRQWPQLQVDRLREQRCLLLGSGTLGCAVARALMGWGIRHVTFVDSGRVAYSNPVRQSLFTYDDAREGKYKAQAAAEQVLRIFPDMTVQAELVSIPMPGHPYTQQGDSSGGGGGVGGGVGGAVSDEAARARLDHLIQSHDIVFNLTDSREARWLPTVLCQVYDKLCINAALGFDSYMVMHHGRRLPTASSSSHGCYFCSDIVAAGNSQRDRTLDEQCTVTRPGLSFIASALCAELLVALLHQRDPRRQRRAEDAATVRGAGGDGSESENDGDDDTGAVPPHQIRGNILGFTQMNLECPVFPFCTACSAAVVDSYRANPSKLVQEVASDPRYLETLSGIAAMVQDIDVNLCIDSDEEF